MKFKKFTLNEGGASITTQQMWEEELAEINYLLGMPGLSPRRKEALLKREAAIEAKFAKQREYEKSHDAKTESIEDMDKRCEKCDTLLNDGGTCPKCDDGEEDYEDKEDLQEGHAMSNKEKLDAAFPGVFDWSTLTEDTQSDTQESDKPSREEIIKKALDDGYKSGKGVYVQLTNGSFSEYKNWAKERNLKINEYDARFASSTIKKVGGYFADPKMSFAVPKEDVIVIRDFYYFEDNPAPFRGAISRIPLRGGALEWNNAITNIKKNRFLIAISDKPASSKIKSIFGSVLRVTKDSVLEESIGTSDSLTEGASAETLSRIKDIMDKYGKDSKWIGNLESIIEIIPDNFVDELFDKIKTKFAKIKLNTKDKQTVIDASEGAITSDSDELGELMSSEELKAKDAKFLKTFLMIVVGIIAIIEPTPLLEILLVVIQMLPEDKLAQFISMFDKKEEALVESVSNTEKLVAAFPGVFSFDPSYKEPVEEGLLDSTPIKQASDAIKSVFESVDEYDEYDDEYDVDDVEMDRRHAALYGGDRMYCKCGHKLSYNEYGSYCPECESQDPESVYDDEDLDEGILAGIAASMAGTALGNLITKD